jgi:hypothetical protein
VWHWDQGHLPYFQFDKLRQIAAFVNANEFRRTDRATLLAATGLGFLAPETHSPWRQYSRTLKLALLVSEAGTRAQPTPIAHLLSQPGAVTCDEYFHFLALSFTEPPPALSRWRRGAEFRYPLVFALKYLLTKVMIAETPSASFDEIIGAYRVSNFVGDENCERFISIINSVATYEGAGSAVPYGPRRQASESLQVISQISYLHVRGSRITASLNPEDAHDMFHNLVPIIGPRAANREAEIRRLAGLFAEGSTEISFDYPHTVIDEITESGFREGSKVKKTHVTIERNAELRREFFLARPTAVCDVCTLNTAQTYPWTERVLDLHHLLPLSSGTRVEAEGTTFDDLVPVCPNCHRAIHRYYDGWLDDNARADFLSTNEARDVYQAMRAQFGGLILNA